MKTEAVTYQSPAPKVLIVDPEKIRTTIELSPYGEACILQGYQWQLSIGDTQGSFSLTLYPNSTGRLKEDYIETIHLLDIVKIYEGGDSPAFIGIVNKKRYVMQAADGGAKRSVSITGTSILGLLSRYKLSLDAECAMIFADGATAGIREGLGESLARLYESGKRQLIDVVRCIYNYLMLVSDKLGTTSIGRYIAQELGDVEAIFNCGGIAIDYPVENPMVDQATNNLYSLIDGIVSPPIYEKFCYMEYSSTPHMRVAIREVPFSSYDWQELRCTAIDPRLCKSISLELSDKEVYTAFYSYLDGYSIGEQKALRLGLMEALNKGEKVYTDEGKFSIYGYSPLTCHFKGYKPTEDMDSIIEYLNNRNKELVEWFSNMDKMLGGSVTIALTYNRKRNPIMVGERVSMLGGEFYVSGIAHSWNYGGGGEESISVTRGGDYSTGKWAELKDYTRALSVFTKGYETEESPI